MTLPDRSSRARNEPFQPSDAWQWTQATAEARAAQSTGLRPPAGVECADEGAKPPRLVPFTNAPSSLLPRADREPATINRERAGAALMTSPSSPVGGEVVHSPIAVMARDFSLWLNSTYAPDLDPEAWFHRRIGKIHEEAGEVREATGAYWHENPRKPAGSLDDVIKELADCVGAALGAIEHLTGHQGRSLDIATERVRFVCERVGVDTDGSPQVENEQEPRP